MWMAACCGWLLAACGGSDVWWLRSTPRIATVEVDACIIDRPCPRRCPFFFRIEAAVPAPPQYSRTHEGPDTEEITFEDMTNGTGKNKPGYEKIRFCGEQARQNGLEYFWIDTCCT
jgi:hypothetical protein